MLIPLEVNVKQEAWTDFKKVQELLYLLTITKTSDILENAWMIFSNWFLSIDEEEWISLAIQAYLYKIGFLIIKKRKEDDCTNKS